MEKKRFKQLGVFTCIYSICIFFGGMMGFILKKSVPSLISASLFGCILFFLGVQTIFCKRMAPILTLICSMILILFFCYRLFATGALFPSGIMALVTSALVVIELRFFQKQRQSNQLRGATPPDSGIT